jgi:hypothetical protein
VSPPLNNPDWYRVVYNLAVLRANRASRPRSRKCDEKDLKAAENDARMLVEKGREQAGRFSSRFGRANRELRRFLLENVVPSAELLLEGVKLSRGAKADPISTIDRVLRNRRVAARVHYNAACLLNTWLERTRIADDKIADRAFDELQRFVWKADPGEAAVIGPWARKDPTLKWLRRHDPKQFDSIFDFVDDKGRMKKRASSPRRRR